jgi:hypothetical protein
MPVSECSNPKGVEQGRCVVESGDLLCQFLVGDITLDDLRTSASEVVRQKSLEEKYRELEISFSQVEQKLNIRLINTTALLEYEKKWRADIQKRLQKVYGRLDWIRNMSTSWWSTLWNIRDIRLAVRPDQDGEGTNETK